MTASDSGAPREHLEQRLAVARDKSLLQGENVIAEVEGDRGQAIVLTDLRVLIIKVGLTATGVADGRLVGEFPLDQIKEVKLRKGPLGGVIQICTDKKPPTPTPAPDNVIVFTGPQRMRACEAIAARIAAAVGVPLGRLEPSGQVPEGSPTEQAQQPRQQRTASEPPTVDERAALTQEAAGEPPTDSQTEVPAAWSTEQTVSASQESSRETVERPRRKSLADEIFEDMTRPAAQPQPAPDRLAPRAEAPGESAEQTNQTELGDTETQPSEEVRPNPNLPRPVRRRSAGDRVVVLFGLLIAALLVGVASVVPLRIAERMPTPSVSPSAVMNNSAVLRRQHAVVSRYETEVRTALGPAMDTLAALESALKSGGKAALAAAARSSSVETAWLKLEKLDAPPGLAGAKQQILSGLFAARTAVASLAMGVHSSETIDARDSLRRLREANSLIAKGVALVEATRRDLKQQLDQTHHGTGVTR